MICLYVVDYFLYVHPSLKKTHNLASTRDAHFLKIKTKKYSPPPSPPPKKKQAISLDSSKF